MFEKIRDSMRDLIRSLDYVMTIHGEEEMENDGLSILDVENAVLTGEIRRTPTRWEHWRIKVSRHGQIS